MSAVDLTPLEQAIWERQGKPEDNEIRFLCPAHDDQNPSARWNSDKETWHCDACKAGGGFKDLASLVRCHPERASPREAKHRPR